MAAIRHPPLPNYLDRQRTFIGPVGCGGRKDPCWFAANFIPNGRIKKPIEIIKLLKTFIANRPAKSIIYAGKTDHIRQVYILSTFIWEHPDGR
jgi:hypothetical protein